MQKIKELMIKYKSFILYAIFGVLTTIVNVVTYYLFAKVFGCGTAVSTIIAWLVAVLFAYVTNKKWVFDSPSWEKDVLIKELIAFFSCRLLTGLLDLIIMMVFVDVLHFNDLIIKVISNIIVIILNYVASKLVIFNNDRKIDYKKIFVSLLILLFLFIITFIVAMNSPLNIFKKSGVSAIDSSVFKSIAFFMSKGFTVYKDLFDHKGPLIYIYNYIGMFISYYKGIWLIEFVSILVTFIYLYKISRLFCGKIYSVISTSIVGSMFFLYFQGGNLTEEYALPFIAISTFIFLDWFLNNRTSTFRLIACGLSFGAVLMLRVNMVTCWFVFCIAVLIKTIIEKKQKNLLNFILYFIIGMLIIVVPIIIWLLKIGAFNDFINDYLIFNFMYTDDISIYNKWSTLLYFINNFNVLIALSISVYNAVNKKDIPSIAYLIYFVLSFLFISMSGRKFLHYGMLLIPIMIYPFAIVMKEVERLSKKNKLVLMLPILLLSYNVIPTWIDGIDSAIKDYDAYVSESNLEFPEPVNSIVKIIEDNSSKDDYITVYGNQNIYYVLTKRLTASKYSYQYPIYRVNDKISDNYFDDLSRNNPKIIVDTLHDNAIKKFINEKNYKLLQSYKFKNSTHDVYIKLDSK